MAYLRRVPGSKFWIAGFTLPDGRRTQRSTKMTDRAKAMKVALAFEEASRNRISEAQALRVMGDIVEQIHGTRLSHKSVNVYATEWLARKRGETKETTMATYESAVTGFLEALGDKASIPLHHVSTAMIAEWRDQAASKATARTANNNAKVIRILFQSAWRDGLIPENPAAKLTSLRTAESNRRPFTVKEIKAVLQAANLEWRGMVLAGLYTGQRLRDIAGMTWANVDLERREIRLATSKTGRRQFIPISAPLLRYLEGLPSTDDPHAPIFPSLYKHSDTKNGSSRLSQLFFEILVNAGLADARADKWKATGKGRDGARARAEVSFHCLRHTTTSLLKAAGVAESVARDLIGHDSAHVSQNYTHTSDESRREAIDKLPDITA
jgi:integrase